MAKYCKFRVEKQQVSYDGGETWHDVYPAVKRHTRLISYNDSECGYVSAT